MYLVSFHTFPVNSKLYLEFSNHPLHLIKLIRVIIQGTKSPLESSLYFLKKYALDVESSRLFAVGKKKYFFHADIQFVILNMYMCTHTYITIFK